jgi:hypothetical protein
MASHDTQADRADQPSDHGFLPDTPPT